MNHPVISYLQLKNGMQLRSGRGMWCVTLARFAGYKLWVS